MSNIKVLVIEDDPKIRESVVDTLEFHGFEVKEAHNGREGVSFAKSFSPDLVLCDVMMPELDGFGVLLELHEDTKLSSIPFIFMTAKASREDIRNGMTLGADDYITKPFTAQELLEGVNSRLEKHRRVVEQASEKLDNLHRYINLHLPHELRTPLTGIMGYLQIIDTAYDELSPEQIRPMLKAIDKSANRLYKLIENYLAYAQLQVIIDNAEMITRLKKYGLNRYPAETIRAIAEQAAYRVGQPHNLQMELGEAQIIIVEDHLRKLIEELLKNAFNFSKAETPVHIRSFRDGDWYVIEFSNFGRGMTPEQISEIDVNIQFDREIYEQQGAGLGLVICRDILKIYGGELVIESVPGEHITVTAMLPISS